jgi:hypothetical protein
MMNARIRLISVAVAALFVLVSTAGHAEHGHHMHDEMAVAADQDIGKVDFHVSCDAAVQDDFNRALGLMHHMMYVQARSAFEAIAARDPDCAMAYWGIATTLFQPLWGTRPSEAELQRGWTAIQRASELALPAGIERMLIEATKGFFQEPESAAFWTRLERWADGMAIAYRAAREDLDTAALYALSRLTLAQVRSDQRDALHDEAEAVLRAVFEEQPLHPGAIHYSIHATDADGRAHNALDMVEVYGRIAPEVPHALHMPTHIYVRLGEWDEVIDWNLRSADAALRDDVNGAISHHYIHAIDYILYAYLQQGEDERAAAVFEAAMQKPRHQASFISAFHLAAMPARKAVERRDWHAAAAMAPRTPGYLPWDAAPWAEGLSWYARGLGAVHTGEMVKAREAEQRLASLRDRAQAEGDGHFATYIEVDRRILAGWLAHADGQGEEAVRLMRSAAELEATVEKHPVTPGALLPPNEALGDLLMALDRPAEALRAYQASDEIWPGRFNTLLGAARAAMAAGDETAARELYGQLVEIAGESRRTGVAEAARILGG